MPTSRATYASLADQHAVAEQVLNTMADVQISSEEVSNDDLAFAGDLFCASLPYTAPANQLLLMECSAELAYHLTARMFDRARPTESTDIDIVDTLSELVNMIGGNLKAVMPTGTCIGLPFILQPCEARALHKEARQLSKLRLATSSGLLCLTFFDSMEDRTQVQ